MKRISWLRPPEALCIMWNDHSITNDADEPHEGAFLQQSVGFLMKEATDKRGNDYLILCQSYDEQEDYSDSLTILSGDIVRRKKLK